MSLDCSRTKDALSAYLDGELSPSEKRSMDLHLKDCDECARELAEFRSLSALGKSLRGTLAVPTPQSFDALAQKLREPPAAPMRRRVATATACAATLLIAVLVAWRSGFFSPSDSHIRETAAMRAYLREFSLNPVRAQKALMAAYSGKRVDRVEASREFKHELLVSAAPAGYRIESTNVFDFPCCRCVQTVFTADESGPVVMLEHLAEQSDWFTGRPTVEVACDGVPCRIVELDGVLASTWRGPSHQVTLIGLKDISELSAWISLLKDKRDSAERPL